MKIILTGFMGSGKTTVGRALADLLGLKFTDMDEYIESNARRGTVAQIFESKGEVFFRRLEAAAAAELAAEKNIVIACGGGIINAPAALANLKVNGGKIIFLNSFFDVIKKRIPDPSSRPLFRNAAAARRLYDARLEKYSAAADHIVDNDGKTVLECAADIAAALGIKKKNFIIGTPVSHSLSPVMHNAGYRALGIEKVFSYGAHEVGLDGLKDFLSARDFDGLSVTMPLKTAIIPLLDEVDGAALKTGAVNTVVNSGGILKGYNTDWLGVAYALGPDIKGKKVALYGAGGAARAALYALKDASEVTIINRDKEKAKKLAGEWGVKCGGGENADVIINATSVNPLSAEMLNAKQTVFDMVYSPLLTPLVKAAAEKGARVVTGEKMLLGQALKQFELFTGQPAPEDVMRVALEAALEEKNEK